MADKERPSRRRSTGLSAGNRRSEPESAVTVIRSWGGRRCERTIVAASGDGDLCGSRQSEFESKVKGGLFDRLHRVPFSPLTTTRLIMFAVVVAIATTSFADAHLPSGASEGKVCRGSDSGISHTHAEKPLDRYKQYRNMYTNCTYIDGNLEIVFLEGNYDYDMSFLKDIQEVTGYVLLLGNHASYIPLTSLRIIRGRTLYPAHDDDRHNGYSLYVAKNYQPGSITVGLKEIHLVSLHEIMDGNVMFHNNNLLCFENTINWSDILTGDKSEVVHERDSKDLTRECGVCHENCTNGKNRNCWGEGPNLCQTLTKLTCSPQCDDRCYGPQPNQCCHSECAGGCDGPKKVDCWACKHFVDERQCVAYCPLENIYDQRIYRKIPNPNAKYAYGSMCVRKCPGHLMADRGACVSDCGTGRQAADDGRCVECDGPCPKVCPGTGPSDFINAANIRNFTGCTVIQGPIRILPTTFRGDPKHGVAGINPADLLALESVREISDYLLIQANDTRFRSLSFFRNLRIIQGRNLDTIGASLHIFQTSLESLDLNLESIRHGGIFIKSNQRLCYVETIRWDRIRLNPEEKMAVSGNGRNCTLNRACDPECTSDGCWGSGDAQCLSCRHYRYGRRCLPSCDKTGGLYLLANRTTNKPGECGSCHEECSGSCHGPGADQCDACKHVRDGPYCVAECPTSKYAADNGTCMPCHENCAEGIGCTGPLNSVGPGACKACDLVIFDGDVNPPTNQSRGGVSAESALPTARCLPAETDCGDGFYRGPVPPELRGPGVRKQLGCLRCHPECLTCSGPGLAFCLDCLHLKEEERCVTNCSLDYYSDGTSNICRPCDSRCLRCSGPTEADCLACRHFKIVRRDRDVDQTMHVFDETPYNCTDKCPEDIPHKKTEMVNGVPETVCSVEPIVFDKRQQVGIAIGVVVGCVVLLGFIAVPIVYLRRQWARAEENKLRLTARMSGLDESEPLTPSDAKPDMAMLRLIKESELRRGNIIGSGAFGTVYKGVWIPEGENVKIPVAIKALQEGTAPAQNKELLEEARVMASVVHPCCVRILAVCMTIQVMLVTPLVPLGALLDYVRRHRTNISSKNFLNWSTQIAKGMAYLEERGIVHRDLAARNVLVQSPNQVKITDFGLAKLLDYNEDGYRAVGGKMPIKWLALECIQYRIFTHKSDVWSFGVTMWELFTYGQKPYENVRAKDISDLLEKGERLSQPSICTIDVYMIMIKCWMLDADSRPSFRELADEFAKMARDPGRYLVIPGDKLMRLPSHSYDTYDLVRNMSIPADGPEEVITAEEYLQPQGAAVRHRRALAAATGNAVAYHINGALELTQEHCVEDDRHRSSGAGRRGRPRPDPRIVAANAQHYRDSPYFFPPPQRHWRGANGDRAASPSSRQDCETATTTTSVDGSPTKELMAAALGLQLPVDEEDYLQPQMTRTSPVYLDLIDPALPISAPPVKHKECDNVPDSLHSDPAPNTTSATVRLTTHQKTADNLEDDEDDEVCDSDDDDQKDMTNDRTNTQETSTSGRGTSAMTSPALSAVNNPEYFDDLMVSDVPDSSSCFPRGPSISNGGVGVDTQLESRPLRLRSQSTESTASEHDEYDRLNVSGTSSAAGGGSTVGPGCNGKAAPVTAIHVVGIGGKSSKTLSNGVVVGGLHHHVFTESVL